VRAATLVDELQRLLVRAAGDYARERMVLEGSMAIQDATPSRLREGPPLIPRPKNATIGDAAAVDVVTRFRRHGAFQERSGGRLPQAPGMRLFFATPR
jgi:hypothetical protein